MQGQELMESFRGLQFPYSREIKDLPLETRPNLQLSNLGQSFYLTLKQIRTELIEPKLRSDDALLLDKLVNDLLGVPVAVRQLYPPENMAKLQSFIEELQSQGIDEMGLSCVMYYILKDFDMDAAERFIFCGAPASKIMRRVPECMYDLVNAMYHIDRFDILRCLKHLNNIDNFTFVSPGIMDHFVKLANIVPYHSPSAALTSNLTELKKYIDVQTCKASARSVVSMVRCLKRPVWSMDMDLQLMYLDCLTELNPGLSIRMLEELRGNYTNAISWEMMLQLCITKILIKSLKQQRVLKRLVDEGQVTAVQFDLLFKQLAMFTLVDTKLDAQVFAVLESVITRSKTVEEDKLRRQYPKYFHKLDVHAKDIARTARNLVLWKLAMSNEHSRLVGLAMEIPELQALV